MKTLNTIAENLDFNFRENLDWDQLFSQCTVKAVVTDQDYDQGATQFTFKDNSCIVIKGVDVTAYNSNN